MHFQFKNKKISGILTVLPQHIEKFDDGMANYHFTEKQSQKLKRIMGYDEKRIAPKGVCSSDLCEFGVNYLFEKNMVKREEVDALIMVTQSPDYFMPATSNILHGKLGLKEDCICLDITQGCCGFIIGLIQSFMLLEQKNVHKVLLLNADVLSCKVSARDRNSHPLIGDGASVTILEKSDKNEEIFADIKFDGKNSLCLNIPAGGFRMPSTPETAVMHEDEAGNFRSLDNLVMKGDAVFNFVLHKVPVQIETLLASLNLTKNDIDYFMCHQPNKFMLEKLADKLGVSYDKLPNNIVEKFGNASGVTIPTNICYNLKNENRPLKLCLSGFGVGLTWAAMVLDLSDTVFLEMIEYA